MLAGNGGRLPRENGTVRWQFSEPWASQSENKEAEMETAGFGDVHMRFSYPSRSSEEKMGDEWISPVHADTATPINLTSAQDVASSSSGASPSFSFPLSKENAALSHRLLHPSATNGSTKPSTAFPTKSFSSPVATGRKSQETTRNRTPQVVTATRNRLEARLEELQRDVASLTMKLRSTSKQMPSLQTRNGVAPSQQHQQPFRRQQQEQEDEEEEEEEEEGDAEDEQPIQKKLLRELEVDEDEKDEEEANPQLFAQFQQPLGEISLQSARVNANGQSMPLTGKTRQRQHETSFASDSTSQKASKTPKRVNSSTLSRLTPSSSSFRPKTSTTPSTAALPHTTTLSSKKKVTGVSSAFNRELHDVIAERDRLRFELQTIKRRVQTLEKRLEEATKFKEAYQQLKLHCVSLQESLDLSERIRERQKKLLQQQKQSGNHRTPSASKRSNGAIPQVIDENTRTPHADSSLETLHKAGRFDRIRRTPTSHSNGAMDPNDSTCSKQIQASNTNQVDIFDSLLANSIAEVSTEESTAKRILKNHFPLETSQTRTVDSSIEKRRGELSRKLHAHQARENQPRDTTAKRVALTQARAAIHSPGSGGNTRKKSLTAMAPKSKKNAKKSTQINTTTTTNASTSSRAKSKLKKKPIIAQQSFLAPTQASLQRVIARKNIETRRPFR